MNAAPLSVAELGTPLSDAELRVLFALRRSPRLRFDVTVELADGAHHMEVFAPDSCAAARYALSVTFPDLDGDSAPPAFKLTVKVRK